jgi:hypothetical protein
MIIKKECILIIQLNPKVQIHNSELKVSEEEKEGNGSKYLWLFKIQVQCN